MRRKEHEARPLALEGLLKSLNLSEVFLKQVQNMTDKDEIYSAKDLTDMEKMTTDTKVEKCFNLYLNHLLHNIC